MERIPFDIKFRPDIEAGKYLVVTRDEREVVIDRWDWPDEDYPIVAHIKEVAGRFTYTSGGEYDKGKYDKELDLFLIPNPDYADWDAFRREAAKDFVAAYFANPNCNNLATDSIIKNCITAADELIWNLKKKKK